MNFAVDSPSLQPEYVDCMSLYKKVQNETDIEVISTGYDTKNRSFKKDTNFVSLSIIPTVVILHELASMLNALPTLPPAKLQRIRLLMPTKHQNVIIT